MLDGFLWNMQKEIDGKLYVVHEVRSIQQFDKCSVFSHYYFSKI